MNGQEILQYALLHTGLNEIPEEYAILYINKAMLELAIKYDMACIKDTTIIETEGNVWEEFYCNSISIQRVYNSINNKVIYDYIVENNQIKFNEKGKYIVEFIRPNNNIKFISNTPEINALFHDAITYFVAYEELCRVFMHEDTAKELVYNKYLISAMEANKKIVFSKRGRKTIKTTPFI